MSLIFHRFTSESEATAFVVSAQTRWPELKWSICSSQEHSDAIDPFPYELQPPIVLVDLHEDTDAAAVERHLEGWPGELAGT